MAYSRFDLVIFDCDGVLVDTEPIDAQVISDLLTEIGVPTTPERVDELSRGMTNAEMWQRFARELGITVTPELLQAHVDRTMAAFRASLNPIEGVKDVLDALKQVGARLCVASSGELDKMDLTLGVTGLMPYFDGHIFSASQVALGKPAPDIFLFAASEMGAAPVCCVVIEDSLNGVRAGLAAGMTVLGFASESTLEGMRELGILTFASMADLPRLIGI